MNSISRSFNLMTQGLQENENRRKKMEERILGEKKFSENLFENSYEAIFISDPHNDEIIKANRQCESLTGRSREELLRLKMRDLVPESEWETIEMEKKKVAAEGRRCFTGTHLLTGSGEMIDVERSETFVAYQDRTVLQSFIRDITEFKRRQQMDIQSQKMESIGTLASGIAHEFNNLLCGILGHVGFIKTLLDADSPALKEVDIIEKSASKAAELTLRLTAFARIGPTRKALADVNAIVKETETLLSGSLNKNIMLAITTTDESLTLKGDRNQLIQVFLNIALNACEAMPGGGILEMRTRKEVFAEDREKPDFTIKAGTYAVVDFKDTGTGMEEKVRQRVFEPFFSTKEKSYGPGLGMSMSFGIIKNHGGYIELESQPAVGTHVTVYLPLQEERAIQEEQPKPVLADRQSSRSILVVDDQKVVRDLCNRILTSHGYQVYLASDGEEALKIFRKHTHDIRLVILDIIMPGMDGGEVFKRMVHIDPGIRVIVLSGYMPNEITQDILTAGPHLFVSKPFLPEDLLETVRKSMSP